MSKEFKILIVDDEVLIAEHLKDQLIELGYSNFKLAYGKKAAIQELSNYLPDIVLLDIRMKTETEGIEIAEEINKNFLVPFVFISAHSDKDMVQKALYTKPAGYITKPFKQADVFAAVHLVESNSDSSRQRFLLFKDGYNNVKLPVDSILYVESDNNYIHIYTEAKKYTIRNSLDWFIENTPRGLFHRTHRSFVVNITKINKTTSKSVFIGATEIPVSRGNQPSLK